MGRCVYSPDSGCVRVYNILGVRFRKAFEMHQSKERETEKTTTTVAAAAAATAKKKEHVTSSTIFALSVVSLSIACCDWENFPRQTFSEWLEFYPHVITCLVNLLVLLYIRFFFHSVNLWIDSVFSLAVHCFCLVFRSLARPLALLSFSSLLRSLTLSSSASIRYTLLSQCFHSIFGHA